METDPQPDDELLEFRAQCRVLDARRGEYWMRRLEHELGLHPDSIARYRSGKYRVPDDVRARVNATAAAINSTASR